MCRLQGEPEPQNPKNREPLDSRPTNPASRCILVIVSLYGPCTACTTTIGYPKVNSRKLEHQYPKSLIQKLREIQYQSS